MKNFSFINARITSQIVLYRYLEGLKLKKKQFVFYNIYKYSCLKE